MPDISPLNEPSTKLDQSQVWDTNPMVDDHDKVPSLASAHQGDLNSYNRAKRTAYIGSDIVDDAISFHNTVNTNSSGVATFYLTDTRLSTGTPLFTDVYEKTISAMPYGIGSNYQVASINVSTDKKTVTITVNQLGSVILGLVNVTSAASGVPVNLTLIGK